MLLWDRLHEAAKRSGAEAYRRGLFHAMPVYELSDVVPLFGSFAKEAERPIPKRPPHDDMWCEWEWTINEDRGGSCLFRFGATIVRCYRSEMAGVDWPAPLDEADENYIAVPFGVLVKPDVLDKDGLSPSALAQIRAAVGVPFALPNGLLVMMADGSRRVEVHRTAPKEDNHSFDVFGVHRAPEAMGGLDFVQPATWPAFMAFALLHCRNVVTEEVAPPERIQRECAKHGRPPRVTYKTLKVEVPKTVHARQSYDGGEDDGPKVRFHLCSGHFKNLQHERYRNKGWHWWPAHWRGSADLGRVEKRYQPVPAGP
jgi:hypothetical protein